MKAVFAVVALVAVLVFLVRVAIGFVRWARDNKVEAGQWAFGLYLREAVGDWVDEVSESPGWFPFEGSGSSHSSVDGAGDGGHHGGCGGDGGGGCGE